MNLVKDAVRVIPRRAVQQLRRREEHDDGSLLLRPGTSACRRVSATGARGGDQIAGPDCCGRSAECHLGRPRPVRCLRPKKAVDGVSLQITRGEIFGLLGPNGAGKTSTLSAIEGLIRPQSGTVLLDGIDIRRHPAQAKAKMGVQLQATSFQSQLTIRQIVRLYAGLYGIRLSDRRSPTVSQVIGLERRGDQAVQAAIGRTAATLSPVHRGRPRTGIAAARRADGRSRSSVAPAALDADRAPPTNRAAASS